MALNPSIFKAYDIRGIYPTDLDEDGMDKIARGIYSFYAHHMGKQPLKVVLSRDMRVSSPVLHDAAKKALLALGAQVLDIGLASTPTAPNFFITARDFAHLASKIFLFIMILGLGQNPVGLFKIDSLTKSPLKNPKRRGS